AYLDNMLTRYPLDALDPVSRDYVGLAAGYAGMGEGERAEQLLGDRARALPAELLRRDTSFVLSTRALIAMSRGQTSEALRLVRMGDAESGYCREWCSSALIARIHDRAGNADSTLVAIERYLRIIGARRADPDTYDLAWALKRSGELHETRGDFARAIARYRELVQLWDNADAELQPLVRDLRERIARLEARRG
ncbi:MAG TPA: hypothetical protein VLD39_14670, partial [Gammaproteobacteria bacterium]|nr:hypothetical protein [Gammaproteobacteria bacterium]